MKASRDDWLREGHAVLRSGRFDAVTIDGLCRRLKLSKGSFYHHFDGIESYEEAMLAQWAESHTFEPIRLSSRENGQLRRKALRKAVRALDLDLERAIRAWATVSMIARRACQRIDSRRIDYLAGCFPEQTPAAAVKQARSEYAQILGELFLFV